MLAEETGLFEATAGEDTSYVIRRNAALLESTEQVRKAEQALATAGAAMELAEGGEGKKCMALLATIDGGDSKTAQRAKLWQDSPKEPTFHEARSMVATAEFSARSRLVAAQRAAEPRLRRFRFFGRFLGKVRARGTPCPLVPLRARVLTMPVHCLPAPSRPSLSCAVLRRPSCRSRWFPRACRSRTSSTCWACP